MNALALLYAVVAFAIAVATADTGDSWRQSVASAVLGIFWPLTLLAALACFIAERLSPPARRLP